MADASSNPLLGRRLLIITAHPDDEAFLCAGTAWQNHRAGGQTALVCATLGEKGSSFLKHPITEAKLKTIRHQELQAGADAAHIKPVTLLHLPDGQLPEHAEALLKGCRRVIRTFRPDAVLTFGPDGITGHRCHIACWQAARQIARIFRLPLYIFTVPPSLRLRASAWFMARRVSPHYRRRIPAYAEATDRIPTPIGYKLRVLKHYRSQLIGSDPFHGFPTSAIKKFTAAEYFAKVRGYGTLSRR